MFGLLRYFSIASAVVLIAVTFALVYLYRDNAMEELVVSAEGQNITLARSFANILWPRFSDYVMTVTDTDGDKLRARPETAAIDEAVRTLTAGLPVLKVKIYNLDGRTIYSSAPAQIGADKSNNPGFLKSARAGKPASKFSFRKNFSVFSGTVMNRSLVESYLPIWGGDDAIEGVFELYTDVTPRVAMIDRRTDRLTAGLLMTFALLYGILFVIVRRADKILKRQYSEQLEYRQQIEDKNASLLREIDERKGAEEALARQSRLLKTTFETMNQGITVYDADHRLVAFNQKFVDLFAFPPAFIRLGMPFEEIVRFNAERGEYGPGNVEAQVRERIIAGDRGEINPRERTRPDGTVISARRDPMPDGGHVTTYSDITARKRVEEALRASEQRLRDIAESSSDWFWEMDAELRFSYFSERYAEITGFDPKERIGTTRNQFSSESDSAENAEEWAAHMADLEARRPFRNFEYATAASADGRVRHVRISGTPIFDANGEFLGYRGAGTDITAQKKAEQALAKQSMLIETTFESISQGIVVYDSNLKVIAFNQRYLDLCGYPPGLLRLGTSFEEIVRFRAERGDYGPAPDVDALVRKHAETRRQGEISKRERTGPDGTEVVVSRNTMPDGGYVTTFTDITDIRRAEEALRESEKRLKVHVAELEAATRRYQAQGKDLAMARDQAEGANRAKSDFLALMSHELRTPLNAIIGFSEIIKSEMMGPIGNPKYGEYATDVFDSAQHLLGLINDILDLSKIEAGKMEFEEEDVDVAEVIRSCLKLVTERAAQGGVKLMTEVPDDLPALRIDERKLKQILLNLLSNAVKFTPEGGSVTVKTWVRPESGFVLQIADTGVGIALEDIPKALAPFGQVDSRLDRKYEGTGLGLPLTKSLIEMHSGSLDLQSVVGAGTTVTVRFPPERIVQRLEVSATGYPAA